MRKRHPRSLAVQLMFSLMMGVLGYMLFPDTASAIPNWSRRYDVSCNVCHSPVPPRLNAYGHKFRRAQYRLPEEFNKDPEWNKLADYVSMRVRGLYDYISAENPSPSDNHTVTSTFKLNDATLFYAGPVTANFSAFVELERPGGSAEIEAVVSAGGIMGDPDNFWTFRIGQFHTLSRVGWGGLDRPTGISSPEAITRDLTAPMGAGFSGGTGFALKQDQVGAEGTYVNGNSRIILQVLNGPSFMDSSTTDHGDDNKDKDVSLAYELMWGDTSSGLTVFGYRGVQDDPDLVGSLDDSLDITRYGITAAQGWENGFEVQGGYVMAKDKFDKETTLTPLTQENIDGEGWWVQVQQYWESAKDLTVFGRYDQTDPNTDLSNNTRTKVTAGLALPVGDWHGRWALELRRINEEGSSEDLSTNEAAVEFMLNF